MEASADVRDTLYVDADCSQFIPDFQYIMVDLASLDVENFHGGPLVRLFLELLKRAKNGTLRPALTNLAIVRVKEEQDYVDNTLLKLVEVLHELDLLDASFYSRIKYGTDDKETICLIKNGLSSSAASLLLKKYRACLTIDVAESRVVCNVEPLVAAMEARGENQIVVDEVENCL